MKITVTDLTGSLKNFVRLKTMAKKTALAGLRKFAAKEGMVNIVFVNAKEIVRLNKQFIGKGHQTDVIAFNYNLGAFAPCTPFGDVYICVDTAMRQSAELGHSLNKELLILTAHGALHLSGLDDASETEKKRMLNLGDRITAGFNI